MTKNEHEEALKLLSRISHDFIRLDSFQQLIQRLRHAEGSAFCGQAVGSSRSMLVAHLAVTLRKPIVVITPDQSGAYLMLDDLEFFLHEIKGAPPVFVFPHLEILPYEPQVPELTIRMERLAPIQHYLESQRQADTGQGFVVISPISAVMKKLPGLQRYEQDALHLKVGSEVNREALSRWLVDQGYEYRDLVAQRGDFSARGDIIDIYSFSYTNPVRVEFWGDEVDSIRLFNISDQRSIESINEVVFYPANEDIMLRESLENNEELRSLFDLFGEDVIIVLAGSDEVDKEGQKFNLLVQKRYFEAKHPHEEGQEVLPGEEDLHKHQEVLLESPDKLYFSQDAVQYAYENRRHLRLTEFTLDPDPSHINLGCATPEVYGEEHKDRINSLMRICEAGKEMLLVCDNTGQQSRLKEIFQKQQEATGLCETAAPQSMVGGLHRGFMFHTLPYIILTDREIFGRYRRFRTPVREGIAMPLSDLMELKPGDYVVHIDHGIGRYVGMKRLTHEGRESEYLELQYAEGQALYVPIEQVDKVGRYIGGDNSEPTLSRLGTKQWERTKARAREAIEDMAEELLDLYATRSTQRGHAFSTDTHWQHEFEASFLYEETPDQWRAIEEVKRDMESDEPMDRLVCGDVGFGKTEVAIRAAFKSVMDGKQVAVLVPTTILCQQHYTNFRERYTEYPIRVEMLSRFLSDTQQKEVVEAVNAGEVDVIVGTHRLLSKDVKFKDLGLIIIDEEQRFGVKHKERLRQIRKLVDTLTLTATPIPRTLYMSLSGIRHMSLVSTPPKNRLPIETYIMEWSNEVVENAILRELSRDGQVYFVHNRVESIYQIASMIQELVPQARVCVGHGQMGEHELEAVMMQFIQHEYDVLVATTIIENGIDIPNVNTIIMNRADHFGLSQLYQLRGRVGRDRHRAYCYLLVQSKQALTPIARRRLLALQEHNQLGSGFHLAMRDMELRGIGNILGRQQHGHIAAIGFDLYSKLLSDTVQKVRGSRKLLIDWETSLEIVPKGVIPPDYVESSKQRMALHQRTAKIKTIEEIEQLREELTDVYGKPPEPVERLLHGLRIRVRAHQAGMDVVKVSKNKGSLRYHLSESERLNPLRLLQLDGWNGLQLRLATEGENVVIDITDKEKRGTLSELIIPLIDALEQEPEPAMSVLSVQQESKPRAPEPEPVKKIRIKNKKLKQRLQGRG